jgi:hypothetical protein
VWWQLSPSAAGSFRVSRVTRLDHWLRIRSDGAVVVARNSFATGGHGMMARRASVPQAAFRFCGDADEQPSEG